MKFFLEKENSTPSKKSPHEEDDLKKILPSSHLSLSSTQPFDPNIHAGLLRVTLGDAFLTRFQRRGFVRRMGR